MLVSSRVDLSTLSLSSRRYQFKSRSNESMPLDFIICPSLNCFFFLLKLERSNLGIVFAINKDLIARNLSSLSKIWSQQILVQLTFYHKIKRLKLFNLHKKNFPKAIKVYSGENSEMSFKLCFFKQTVSTLQLYLLTSLVSNLSSFLRRAYTISR